jgi:hypothetical protein
MLAKQTGAVLRVVINDAGELILDQFAALRPRTIRSRRQVSIP